MSLLRDAGRVLLGETPRGLDQHEVARAIRGHPGVLEVRDVRLSEVTSGFQALAAHVLVAAGEDCHRRRRELQRLLAGRFNLDATLRVTREDADDVPAVARQHADDR